MSTPNKSKWYPGKYISKVFGSSKKENKESEPAPENTFDLKEVTDLSSFLATAGHVCTVGSFLFDKLGSPFAATGLIFGVILTRINQCQDAVGSWKELKTELQDFIGECEGSAGYTALFQCCASVEGDELRTAAEELQNESVKMTEIFAEMISKVDGFFKDEQAKIIFTANASKDRASESLIALQRYRRLLKGKLERFGFLTSVVVLKTVQDTHDAVQGLDKSFKQILLGDFHAAIVHPAFSEFWKASRFRHIVDIPSFISALRSNGTCSTNSSDRFSAFLRTTVDQSGSFGPPDINIFVSRAKIASDLSLADSIDALLGEKEVHHTIIEGNALLRDVWKFNEGRAYWKNDVSIKAFCEGVSQYAQVKGMKGTASPITELESALKNKLPEGIISAYLVGSWSEKIDDSLALHEVVSALVTLLTPSPPESPPKAAALKSAPTTPTVVKTAPPKFSPIKGSDNAKSGKCDYCSHPLQFGSIKNGVLVHGKRQIDHAKECPNSPY